MKTFFATAETATVHDYPYGRLKCSATFGTEFNPKKGYRSTFQTVNPKTGRVNAVKKSTYYALMLMYKDSESGHIKHMCKDIYYSDDTINKTADFCAENAELFTAVEIHYLFQAFLVGLKVSMISAVRYGGAKMEDIAPMYAAATEAATAGLKAAREGRRETQYFALIRLDAEAIKAKHPENYNPFVTTQYSILDGNGFRTIGDGTREVTPAEMEALENG